MMAKYLFHGSYTEEGIKGVLKEGGSRRIEAVDKLMKSLGGSLETFYWGFGGDDFYVIAELPDNAAAAAGSLMVTATGTSRVGTTVLLTAEDIDAASKRSGQYRPPGG
jgi:uncharacterized protein with GYD domain